MIRAALILLLSCLSAQATYMFQNATNAAIADAADWIHDLGDSNGFDQGYYAGWGQSTIGAGNTVSATLSLGQTFSGDVSAWALISKDVTVTYTIDGVSNSVVKASTSSTPEWVRVGVWSGTSSFSNVVMNVYSASGATVYFEGVFLSNDTNVTTLSSAYSSISLESYYFMSMGTPVATDASATYEGNRIPNSAWGLPPLASVGMPRNATAPFAFPTTRMRHADTNSYSGYSISAGEEVPYNWNTGFFHTHDEYAKQITYTLTIWYTKVGSGGPFFIELRPLFSPGNTTATNLYTTNTTYSIAVYGGASSVITNVTYQLPLNGGEYKLNYYDTQSITTRVVAVSLTPGTNFVDWAPLNSVEFCLTGTNEVNVYDASSAVKPIRVIAYNTTSNNVDRTYRIEERAWDNVVLTNYDVDLTWSPGVSTQTFNLAVADRLGFQKVVAWDTTTSNLPPQAVQINTLYTRVPTNNRLTNFFFAVHAEQLRDVNEKIAWIGWEVARMLSPAEVYNPLDQNTASGVFDFVTSDADLEATVDFMEPIVSIADISAMPSFWFTNSGTELDLNEFEMWNTALITHDGAPGSNRVRFVEQGNERQYWATAGILTSNKAALMNQVFQDSISNADPSAIIIHGGGYANYGAGTFAENEWDATDSGTKKAATNGAYSFHFYPENQYLGRWHYEKLWNRTANQQNAIDFAKNNGFTFIMNSESGPYSSPFMPEDYVFLGDKLIMPGEIMNGYLIVRQTQYDGVAYVRDCLRCVAQGAAYCYYTGSRMFSEAFPPLSSDDSGWDSHGGVDPLMASFLTAQHILGNTLVGLGRVNHPSESWLELNMFQASDGRAVAVLWSQARTNIAIVPTNTALQVLDYYENEVATNPATIIVGTRPVYLRSSTLTTNNLFSAITNGLAYQTNDAYAPDLVFYRQPVGQNPPDRMLKIRWGTGTRGRSLPAWKTTGLNRPAMLARWALNNTNWSEWTERDYAELPKDLADGYYVPSVELLDEFGFGSTNNGIGFTIGSVSGTLDASTINVGTLIINP